MLLPSQIQLPKSRWIIFLSLCAIAIGFLLSAYVYIKTDTENRLHIVDRTNSIAQAISAEDLAALTATDADLSNQKYLQLKKLLTNIRKVNHDVRFVYIIGIHDNNELFFYVDSEDPTSVDYSPPGQTYDEAPLQMYQTFGTGKSNTDGPTVDRWGTWVSGYSPIFDATGKVIAIVGVDIPARDHLINNIVYASLPFIVTIIFIVFLIIIGYNRYRENHHIAQKAEFLSIAAHEIRTPLVGIKWALESLLTHSTINLDGKMQQIVTLAESSTGKLLERINNLLNVTRFESGSKAAAHKTWTPLLPMLEEIIDSLRLSANQRNISFELNSTLSMTDGLLVDGETIRYAFSNLVSNAVKYTNPNTRITIRTELTEKVFTLHISDQGNGISLSEQQHIFDGYHRTAGAIKSGQYGTGLGLYLTKKIIESHGGKITVFSIQKQGTTFTCTLPVV